MITTANFDHDGKLFTQYNQLFTDAWTALIKKGNLLGDKDKLDAANGKTSFSNLQHYLSYLKYLIQIDPIYLMLPIDEKPFSIDTNTRSINPPEGFSANNQVQSDNYAEILTFSVDRYFDYQDLSLTTIGVQWINETSRKEGISIIKLIDLKTYGDENRIRFGWPLTKDMTDTPGNLRFAVRFFTRDQNGEFAYLLNTTSISIPIKETLTYHSEIDENDSDYNFFKTYIQNSMNPSYAIPTRVNFYDAPGNTAAIIVNPGEEDDDTLTLSAQAGTADLNPIVYKWYHEYDGYKQYRPRSLETGKFLSWPKIRPATPTLYVVDGKATELNDGKPIYTPFKGEWPEEEVDYLFELNPRYLITGDQSDLLYSISSSWHLYNPTDENGQEVWPTVKNRPLFTLWTKKEGTEQYEPFRGEWPKEKPTGKDSLYFSKTELFFKPEDEYNADIADTIVGKYYVRGINEYHFDVAEEGYNRTETEAPALGCEIAPPQEITISKNTDTSKFFDNTTPTNNVISVELQANDKDLSYKTYTVQKLNVVTNKDTGTTTSSWADQNSPTPLKDNKAEYQVNSVGKYRFYLQSKLNRANKHAYSSECEFFKLPETLNGVIKINDALANQAGFPYYYNNSLNTVIIGRVYNEETNEWEESDSVNNLGASYTFYIYRDLEAEDSSSIGDVEYKWQYAIADQPNAEFVEINDNMINSTGLLQKLEQATYADYIDPITNLPFVSKEAFNNVYPGLSDKLGSKLTVQVQNINTQYQFVCNIHNKIETTAGEVEDTVSESYNFYFE